MQEWDEEIYMSGVRECRSMGGRIDVLGAQEGETDYLEAQCSTKKSLHNGE